MSRNELRTLCPECGGELVGTKSGAVCLNAAMGFCDRSRVMQYAVVVHPNQHTYDAQLPEATWSKDRRRWVVKKRLYRRDTKRRVIDAYCAGATIARTKRGRLIVLVPARRKPK